MSYYLMYYHFPYWNQYLIWVVLVPSVLMMIGSFYFTLESLYYCVVKEKNVEKFN
jgi:hypothetical protein